MAFLDDFQNWTFDGILLARRITQASEWEEWFLEDTIRSIEPVLDSSERYLDVAGSTIGALVLPFAFADLATRSTFLSKRGTVAVLARTGYNPRSRLALFATAQEIASRSSAFTLLACTFEAL